MNGAFTYLGIVLAVLACHNLLLYESVLKPALLLAAARADTKQAAAGPSPLVLWVAAHALPLHFATLCLVPAIMAGIMHAMSSSVFSTQATCTYNLTIGAGIVGLVPFFLVVVSVLAMVVTSTASTAAMQGTLGQPRRILWLLLLPPLGLAAAQLAITHQLQANGGAAGDQRGFVIVFALLAVSRFGEGGGAGWAGRSGEGRERRRGEREGEKEREGQFAVWYFWAV